MRAQMSELTYLSNDYCWAIYIDNKLKTWGRHGDDPVNILKGLGFKVKCGRLRELDGEKPPLDLK